MKRFLLSSAAGALALSAFSFAANAATVTLTEVDYYGKSGHTSAPLVGDLTVSSSTGNFVQVVSGNQLPNARTPYEDNPPVDQTTPYSVLAYGGGAGTATYNLSGGTTFSILWGSPDTYNFVQFYDTSNNAIGPAFSAGNLPQCDGNCNQLHWDLVAFNSDTPLGKVVLSDTGQAAFEYGSSLAGAPATPLPAAFPLFASGLGALGLLGWRKKRKAA